MNQVIVVGVVKNLLIVCKYCYMIYNLVFEAGLNKILVIRVGVIVKV